MARESTLLTVCHDYRHGYGRLTAFFEGLAQGRAAGAECPSCRQRWFPPQERCDGCDAETRPVDLPPTGRIESITLVHVGQGQPAQGIALVRLDGACNRVMMRVSSDETPKIGDRVRLLPVKDVCGHPAIHLQAEVET